MPTAAQPNIVLTGFMGTGKTAVGRRLAKILHREFVDMDDLIEEHAGISIVEIFARQGEAAFRQLEHEVCLDVARRTGLVVATGGGTVVNQVSRQALQESGFLICLTAAPEEILNRIGADSNRPMLATDTGTRQERIKMLLEERARHYNAIPHQVDTTCLTQDEVVSHIKQLVCAQPRVHE